MVYTYKVLPETIVLLPDKLTDIEIAENCQSDMNSIKACPNGDYIFEKTDTLRNVYNHGKFLVYTDKLENNGFEITTTRTNSILFYLRAITKTSSGCTAEEAKNGCDHI